MKKKIDRCKFNIANIIDSSIMENTIKPYCVWYFMGDFNKPAHMDVVITPTSKLTKSICKNCQCFDPIIVFPEIRR